MTTTSGELEDRLQTPENYFGDVHTNRSFAVHLEQKARRIIGDETSFPKSDAIIKMLVQELALVIDHLDSLRMTAEHIGRNLLQNECSIDTELMQMEQRTPRYSPYRFPEREKLQRRLLSIDHERRRFRVDHKLRLQALHDRLFALLAKHEQLKY